MGSENMSDRTLLESQTYQWPFLARICSNQVLGDLEQLAQLIDFVMIGTELLIGFLLQFQEYGSKFCHFDWKKACAS